MKIQLSLTKGEAKELLSLLKRECTSQTLATVHDKLDLAITRGNAIVISIDVASGKVVKGYSRHGRWKSGDHFVYDGKRYTFNGVRENGVLHAVCLDDKRLVEFGSSYQWEAF